MGGGCKPDYRKMWHFINSTDHSIEGSKIGDAGNEQSYRHHSNHHFNAKTELLQVQMQHRVVHVLDAGEAKNSGKHQELDLAGQCKSGNRILERKNDIIILNGEINIVI